MNILMMRPQMNLGGVESHIQLLVRELVARDYIIGLATGGGATVGVVRQAGATITVLPLYPSTPVHLIRSVLSLCSYVRTHRVDLLHSHHRFTTIVGRAVSSIMKVPLVVTVHEFKQDRRWLASTWTGTVTITPSTALRDHLQAFYGVPRYRLCVVPNAVDATPYIDPMRQIALRKELAYDPSVPWIGFIGRLAPEKGCKFLVEAMPGILQRHAGARFVIAGSGPDAVNLRRQVHGLGLEANCIFVGERSEIAELLELMDVIVIPSLAESFSLVALEAMRAERPVVASSVGGIPEVVRDGETGILVPPQSSQALGAAVAELLDSSEKRSRLGLRGRQVFLEQFVPSVLAERTLAAYRTAGVNVDDKTNV